MGLGKYLNKTKGIKPFLKNGDKENGRNGGKGSFENRKLGRWKRGK